MLCGDIAGTYLIGLGLGAALAARDLRRRGLLLCGLGLCYVLAVGLVGGNKGSGLGHYDYLIGATATSRPSMPHLLVGLAGHPAAVLRQLWDRRVAIWSGTSTTGVLGLMSPWTVGIGVITLLENDLRQDRLFAAAGYQNVVLYLMLPFGTIWFLSRLRRWRRGGAVACVVAVLVAVNSVAWAVVWAPRIAPAWLQVSPAAAQALSRAERVVPGDAAVVVSQGVAGRFSSRRLDIPWLSAAQQLPASLPPVVWFVVAPDVGIETVPNYKALAFIGKLAGPMGAELELHADGVWVFRWAHPAGTRPSFSFQPRTIPAWALDSVASEQQLTGPSSTWHLSANGRRGYVASGDYWRKAPGDYAVKVAMATTGPVNVEVWNATGNVLVARRTLQATSGVTDVRFAAPAGRFYVQHEWSGWGLFTTLPLRPPAEDNLEVRIWSPGGVGVTVYTISLVHLAPGS